MKRDLDLLRAILLLTEDQPAGEPLSDFSRLDSDNQTVVEHIWLAHEGGLLERDSFRRNHSQSWRGSLRTLLG